MPLTGVFFLKKNKLSLKPLSLIFKKLIKLSKKKKSMFFFYLKKNLVLSKKSKNCRMGKGKGQNISKLSFNRNLLFRVSFLCFTRTYKLKKKINFFLKKKITIMLNSFMKISFFLFNLILVIFFVLLGGVLPLIERKFLSLVHRRVGPKFVGYKGRLQFLADAFKLLIKEVVFLKNSNSFSFLFVPIFLLNLNLFMVLNFFYFNNVFVFYNDYSVLYVLIIESLNNIMLFSIGFFIKNKYTHLSSVRVLNMYFIFEIIVFVFFTYVYFFLKKFSINQIGGFSFSTSKILFLLPVLPVFYFIFLFFLKKPPFDLIEAETEIVMGVHTEYSGFLSGMLILVEYLHLFF